MGTKIKINEIKVYPGQRAVLEHDVEEYVFSISETGLLNPLTPTGNHILVAERRRPNAVKLLVLDENFARKTSLC